VEAEPASLHLVASKGQWSRIGPYLVHLSVLIILFGATLGALMGFRGSLRIPEGETVDSIQLPNEKGPKEMGFGLRCDDFEVSYYEGTQRPQEYRSELVIIEAGKEVAKKAVRVNDPLVHKGIYFYQSSFGYTGQVKSITLSLDNPVRKESLQIKVPVGKAYQVEGTDYLVQVLRFLPDFGLDEHFVPFSRSDEFRNPAAEIEIRKGGRSLLRSWVFGREVSFHGPRVRSGLRVQLTDYEATQFTGLQVSYDPGVGWVWAGFLLMSIGLALSLLFTEKRIWMRMTKEEGRWKAQAWGQARRGKIAFEQEFTRVCSELEGNGSSPGLKRPGRGED
jgi:cytochrome c biogenesis protein